MPHPYQTLLLVMLVSGSGWGQAPPIELFHQMQAALGGFEQIAAIHDFDELSVAETFNARGEPVRVQKRVRWVKPIICASINSDHSTRTFFILMGSQGGNPA
jgi:hypothetical protein